MEQFPIFVKYFALSCIPFCQKSKYKNPLKKKYPNDFEEPRWDNRHFFTQEKVLINTIKRQAWGQRITVGVDRKGIYVAHNFNIIALREDNNIPGLTHEVIAAVLA
jgi:hypothetical protein